jgi:hypothetical protein
MVGGVPRSSRGQQVFRNVEADKFYLIEEGKDQLQRKQFARRAAGPKFSNDSFFLSYLNLRIKRVCRSDR